MKKWYWFQAISFQVIWLTAVLGGNQWLFLPLLILLLHFIFSPCRQQDIKILPLALIGITVDTILTQLGILKFNEWPLWLLLLWFAFILNFGHSMVILRRLKLIWLIMIGAASGCYAYLAGWKLGVVQLPLGPWITCCILATLWAIMIPALVRADFYLREKRS